MTAQMRVLRPFAVTPESLTSNLGSGAAPEYSALTTYSLGQQVKWTSGAGATNHLYESLVAGNLGNALADDTKWLDLGANNRWAMFDEVIGTRSVSETSAGIDVSIDVTGRSDGLALLNMDAEQVQVTMIADGGTVYDEVFNLVSAENITDWFAYFNEPIVYMEDLVLLSLPNYPNPTVRVQVTKTGANSAVGKLVVGQLRSLGATLQGASVGIRDYSKPTTDEFGNTVLTRRAFAKRGEFKLATDPRVHTSVARLLADLRATPVMWIGSEGYASTWIYGFVKDWNVDFAVFGLTYTSLQIEGLT